MASEINPCKVAEERSADEINRCPAFSQVVDELKELWRIGLPMILTNLLVYVRAMVSVFCMGRLGSLELAGGALAVGFTNITGYSVLFGLASGMDPVCGQAFGSKNWPAMGLALQRTTLMLLSACIPISFVWINLRTIMLSLGQDPGITEVASLYCRFALPDLAANAILQPLRVYLKSQGMTAPMMWCSFAAVLLHVPISVLLVFLFKLGVPGVAIATWWTNLNMAGLLVMYLLRTGAHARTWARFSAACLTEWRPLLGLALPSCLAVCLEWWWYEIMTLLAGYLPDPRTAVATAAVIIQTTSLMYTVPVALGSSVSTRVGNELGASRPAGARTAALVALGCAVLAALVNVAWTVVLRHFWGRVFTDDEGVLALTAAVLPIIGLCELGNCPQTTGCGVLRGSARPAVGARINLGSFYFVGTPVALVVGFLMKRGLAGLCYGLLAAQIACTFSVLYHIFVRTDWALEAARARQLGSSSLDEEAGLLTEAAVK